MSRISFAAAAAIAALAAAAQLAAATQCSDFATQSTCMNQQVVSCGWCTAGCCLNANDHAYDGSCTCSGHGWGAGAVAGTIMIVLIACIAICLVRRFCCRPGANGFAATRVFVLAPAPENEALQYQTVNGRFVDGGADNNNDHHPYANRGAAAFNPAFIPVAGQPVSMYGAVQGVPIVAGQPVGAVSGQPVVVAPTGYVI
jgi:hypothetical protein